MGVYKKAVITDAGRAMMARSIAGEIVMQFSRAVTSSHIYPSDTDFKGYTSLDGIQQTVIPSNVQVVNDTLISVRNMFGNESILESYLIQNIGLYATDGNEEVLFSVSQATTPDEMPGYNGVAPSSFIYTIQATVSQASSLSLTINPAGTATAQDIQDLDGAKLDKHGDISETVVETLETIDTKFPIPAAGETIKRFLGKVLAFMKQIKPLEADVTYYVATTGSDTDGNGNQDKPFKTLQRAISIIPKNLGGYRVTVYLADGIYPGFTLINGFYNGTVIIRPVNRVDTLSDDCIIGSVEINGVSCRIALNSLKIADTGLIYPIVASSAQMVDLNYMKIVQSMPNNAGVVLYNASNVYVSNCDISNRGAAIYNSFSNAYIYNCTGANNSLSINTFAGGRTTYAGTIPGSTYGIRTEGGGVIFNGAGTQISNMITSGLSCTWGTISGGYVRHGNISGVAMVTIQVGVTLTSGLTAGTTYSISGFPGSGYNAAVTCEDVFLTSECYFNAGSIRFKPSSNIIAGHVCLFSCTYLTTS